jgi:hypothetical protein
MPASGRPQGQQVSICWVGFMARSKGSSGKSVTTASHWAA